MKFGKIYSDSTGRKVKETEEPTTIPKEEDAARFQVKHSWMQSSMTQEMISRLISQHNNFVEEAINLSVSYPEHQNAHKIIHKLVSASQLKQLINEYSQIK